MTVRVLCLDIEGGYGGSSRSLFEYIRHLPEGFEVEVWCRRDGPIRRRYEALGIACRIVPSLPHVSSLPRFTRNLAVYGLFIRKWWAARRLRRELLREIVQRFDLVHFNHEGLFLLAAWLRRRTRKPFSMHVRTNLWKTAFARWQCRTAAAAIDHLVFITENEEASFRAHGGNPREAAVIPNIVSLPEVHPEPLAEIKLDASYRIACLSNYSYTRGLDRLIDVAEVLKEHERHDIRFVVAGNMALSSGMPGELGRLGRQGKGLGDFAAARGVAPYFQFLGHVGEPERVLSACHALAKPTREANPWGRDILEAMAYSLPVFSVGTYDRFVETGETGVLQNPFDAAELAGWIERLADERAYSAELGANGQRRVATLCDGRSRAADLADVWRVLVNRDGRRHA